MARPGGDCVGLRRGCQGEEKAKRRRDTHRTNGEKEAVAVAMAAGRAGGRRDGGGQKRHRTVPWHL